MSQPEPPLTPLTRSDERRSTERPTSGAPLPPGKAALRLVGAILIWLAANLLTFLVVSFLVFALFAGTGMFDPDAAFTLAVLCAIPPALTVSSLLAGRKIFYIVSNRFDK